MKIIGITGTLGAGKGTIVDYLRDSKGYTHYSVREFIAQEITRRGFPVNRDTLTEIGNDIRKNHGGDYIFQELRKKAEEEGKDAIAIESIRTVDEVNALEKVGGILFSVDADPELRYKRAVLRKSETDRVSFEKFKEDELRESQSTDPAKQNLVLCRKMTKPEFQFTNNGSFEDLHRQIDTAMTTFLL